MVEGSGMWKGKDIIPPPLDKIVEIDASMIGWGAGSRTLVPSGERLLHQCLRTDSSPVSGADIHKRRPQHTETHSSKNGVNILALTYVSRMGGTCSSDLMRVACSL